MTFGSVGNISMTNNYEVLLPVKKQQLIAVRQNDGLDITKAPPQQVSM
jgi:hypothetical protein